MFPASIFIPCMGSIRSGIRFTSMDPGASPSNSRMAKLVALISSNITKGTDMAYVAKRGKNRCPTHPGALLRDDIIPATGRTKAEIAGLLGISRQHLYDILQERKPVSPTIAVRLGKLFGDGAGIGRGCRPLTIPGMRNVPKTSVISRPSRVTPPKVESSRNSAVANRGPCSCWQVREERDIKAGLSIPSREFPNEMETGQTLLGDRLVL